MIKLVNDLYLDADKLQFILKLRMVNQNKDSKNYGEEYFNNVGYYPNLGDLMKSAALYGIRRSDFDTLKQIEKTLNDIKKEMNININKIDFESLKVKLGE